MVAAVRSALASEGEDGGQLQVELGWPGDQAEAESVWLEGTTGTVEHPAFENASRPGEDRYSVAVLVRAAAAGQTLEQAEARVDEIGSMVAGALADPGSYGDVYDAVLGQKDGPLSMRESMGAVAEMRFIVNIVEMG